MIETEYEKCLKLRQFSMIATSQMTEALNLKTSKTEC